ncbi:MAG: UDP-3-O-(3-hydroxymyristoyl)glucosamine N-acyltransferase [Lacipirellulaceae bacterium]
MTKMTNPATLAELAAYVGGTAHGDATIVLHNAWPLDDATPGTITMIDHVDRLAKLGNATASAVVAPRGVRVAGLPTIEVDDVHSAFIRLVERFRPSPDRKPIGVHPTASIAASASLGSGVGVAAGAVIGERVVVGDGCEIGPNAVIGDDCRLGANVYLAAGVTIYAGAVIGDRCRLHSGAVLGADGFGYRQADGRHVLAAQLGNVELGADVEIGANSTIDRGAYGPTKIGEGTKIDNLVQIAHNCRIGRHNLICSQVGIAGSTTTGDYVVMAGQVGVRDHVHIGDHAVISAMAGVSNDVPAGETMLGAPAVPIRESRIRFAAIAKLPEIRKEVRALRLELNALRARLGESRTMDPRSTERAA